MTAGQRRGRGWLGEGWRERKREKERYVCAALTLLLIVQFAGSTSLIIRSILASGSIVCRHRRGAGSEKRVRDKNERREKRTLEKKRRVPAKKKDRAQ